MIAKNSLRLVAALGLAFAAVACNETPKDDFVITRSAVDGLPSVNAINKKADESKIVAVDYDKRTVTLNGSDGKTETFTVPAAVVNFKQIRAGDIVKVKYTETIDANVSKAGSAIVTVDAAALAKAPLGDKPGIFAYRSVETVTNVKAIDYEKRTITLANNDGKTISLPVSKLLTNFDAIKVDDHVVFTYSESILIQVVAPK